MEMYLKVIALLAVILIILTAVPTAGKEAEVEYLPRVERGVPLTITIRPPGEGCVSIFVDGLLQDMKEVSGDELRFKLMTNRFEGGLHNLTLKFSSKCSLTGEVLYTGAFYVEDDNEKWFFLKFSPGEITFTVLAIVTALLVILSPGKGDLSSDT